jgi:hypothetical protein
MLPMQAMRFQGQSFQISGWKAGLMMVLGLVVVAVVAFLGLFVLAAGVVVSGLAALVYGVRARLAATSGSAAVTEYAEAPRGEGQLAVREIQVDEVVVVRDEP